MRTIDIVGQTISEDIPHPTDQRYPPSKTFKNTIIESAFGFHFYSQLPDGKTTTNTLVPKKSLRALVEKLEPRYSAPKAPSSAIDSAPKSQ